MTEENPNFSTELAGQKSVGVGTNYNDLKHIWSILTPIYVIGKKWTGNRGSPLPPTSAS
jgi:hypothetical protein